MGRVFAATVLLPCLFLLAPAGAAQTQPLSANTGQLSVSQGGGPTFSLDPGVEHAGKLYILVGSFSGTVPGIPLGPSTTLPLNWDAYTAFLDFNPNLLIQGSLGFLDAQGRATAQYNLPPGIIGPEHSGLVMHHAYVVFSHAFNAFDLASNAVPLTLAP